MAGTGPHARLSWIDAVMVAVSIIVAVIVCIAVWNAGVRPYGMPLNLEDLEHVGAFVGGVAAPLGVAWIARTFYLQRLQLIQSIHAVEFQARMQRDQYERDHHPVFTVQGDSSVDSDNFPAGQSGVHLFRIVNHGAPSAPTVATLWAIGDSQAMAQTQENVRPINFSEEWRLPLTRCPTWTSQRSTQLVLTVIGSGANGRTSRQWFFRDSADSTTVSFQEISEDEFDGFASKFRAATKREAVS